MIDPPNRTDPDLLDALTDWLDDFDAGERASYHGVEIYRHEIGDPDGWEFTVNGEGPFDAMPAARAIIREPDIGIPASLARIDRYCRENPGTPCSD